MQIDFQNFNLDKLSPKNEFECEVVNFIKLWFSEEKYVSVKTSGSTGMPKIIQVEREKMCISAKMTCDFLNLKEGNSALLCLPIEYISGKMMIVRAIERKLKIYVENSSLKPLKNFSKKIDFCAMTPLQVENSLDKIHLIKKLIIGGAKVSEHLKFKISQISNLTRGEAELSGTKSQIYETYGMSETLSHIALKEIFPINENYFTVIARNEAISRFNNIEISKDERNCLQIFAPMLNSEVLKTNDIVEIKNENQFKFIGRADFIINSGGLKISPEVLEKLVKKSIPNELIFVGIKDEILGEKLVLVIEGEKQNQILEKLKEINFPSKNHKPKEVVFLKEFPRSETGKILRFEIKKTIENND
ncbi:long-chain fatty acid--CoA ligase [Halpernia sp.]|uniref:long-chain fatty acid--CoA ligase n=1 Tax=Halpernia sp. TaxID=2782209 RepID=UPI003A8C9DC9